MDLLFKNVTAITMMPEAPVLYNAQVGVKDGKIALITGASALAPAARRVIDGTNKVLIPGLYNCHTHAAMTLFRGFANDLALEDWLFNHIFPAERKLTPEIVYTGTQIAIAEMVASGTVAFSDMYFFMDEVARAADEAGVLANVSNAVIGMDRDTYDFHEDRVYAQSLNVLKSYHVNTGGRIRAEASIHGVYTSFAPAWKQVTDFAGENSLRLHIHLSETKTEQDNCVAAYGKTPARVFEEHGVFDLPVTAAHCVWATEEDMDILARHGVTAVHNPVSNLKLASGVAPVARMLAKGVNVAIGTDGMSSNNSHDLFEEIKIASILQKYAANDPTAAPALETLRMATVNGAKAQGRGDESGVLAEGYYADLVLMDFDSPRLTPCFDPVLGLAYSATGRDVAMTLCRGKILYENGEYKTIDVEKALFDARRYQKIITH
ncbi:MAG: amidohydrolase [Clostridiales bacterium]|jgi:5-methylthioadenosine/S-adenosylhomocysteine deaminase|nr:amidohydrolase [Clostridiales bacterium]